MVGTSPIYVPSADGVTIDHDNIVSSDSGRVENGQMHITWVRRDVRKVSLTYKMISGAAVAYMNDLMQGKEFTLTYYDNGIKTMQGYCGKNSYSQHDVGENAADGGTYYDYKINIEEM